MTLNLNKYTNILLIFKTYILVLSIFSFFRILLFLNEINRVLSVPVKLSTVLKSFIMGIRFDIVISGYILFIPAFVLFTVGIITNKNNIIRNIIFWWIYILFTIAFVISAADIPYFNQFYSRFSIGAFEWFDNLDFVFSMIIQEPKYFLIVIPFFIISILFFYLLKKIFKVKPYKDSPSIILNIVFSLLALSIMFIGIRGRIQKKSPIRIGTAYFSNNSFLNKLGLNPVFTLMRSYLDSFDESNQTISMINNESAIENIQYYLGIENQEFNSPIARSVNPDTILSEKYNIVLIIMESMSAAKMTRHGNTNNLTPFLDSISNNSYYFENIYTAGKHTFNGIFSTLFSFPAIYRAHPMKNIREYNGFGTTLLNFGYSTTYITTHDSQFDNAEGFLRANGFQNIISQSDYPLNEIKTTLGVPDDYMFRHAIPVIDKLASLNNPFFVTFMTASDHGPYYIPDYFYPKSENEKQQIVEYADWSLEKFISLSSKKEWFKNTIFIFIADHGAPMDASYDIALNYHHSPLIFYAPNIFEDNSVYSCIGGQIDIFPTTMGILNLPYCNNTLGIDLLREKRPYILINDDDKIGVLDTNQYLIFSPKTESKLFNYNNIDLTNYINKYKDKAIEMEDYAKANMQVFQYMQLNNKTKVRIK